MLSVTLIHGINVKQKKEITVICLGRDFIYIYIQSRPRQITFRMRTILTRSPFCKCRFLCENFVNDI